jgi:WD40 repeat protein
MILAGSADGTIKVWDMQGSTLFEFPTAHEGGLTSMVGNPKAQALYTGGKDGSLKFWSQAARGDFEGTQGSAVTALAVSPDGKRVLSGGADGKVKVWDADTHKLLMTIDAGHTGGVTAIAVSPDGSLIVTGGADKKGRAWDAHGDPLKTVDVHDGTVTVILFESRP